MMTQTNIETSSFTGYVSMGILNETRTYLINIANSYTGLFAFFRRILKLTTMVCTVVLWQIPMLLYLAELKPIFIQKSHHLVGMIVGQ